MSDNYLKIYDEAVCFLKNIPDTDSLSEIQDYFSEYFDGGYDPEKVIPLLSDICNEKIRRNLLIIYGLIYLLSKKYPQEIFGSDAIGSSDDSLSQCRICTDSYNSVVSIPGVPSKIKFLTSREVSSVEYALRGNLVKKFLDVSLLKNANIAEFLTVGAILKDQFFVAKSYDEIKWAELFKNEKNCLQIKENSRIEQHIQCGRSWDIHAVTMQGNNHKKCDDYSKICKIDNKTWFCCSADGVGSSPDSHIGSRIAAQTFEEKIKNAYKKYGPTKKLMWYIRFELAKNAARTWKTNIQKEIAQQEFSTSNFATTFLFTFCCEKFIACGQIGDGNFLIEKQETINSKKRYGYLSLSDGFSGVTQAAVLNVAHLLKNPSAMQISFFEPDEISGIIMTSDGANGLFYKNIDGILFPQFKDLLNAADVLLSLKEEKYQNCKIRIHDMCAQYSSANKYSGGRGDDCTVVYVKNRRD